MRFIVVILLMFPLAGRAQQASTMKFAGDEWDFGHIREVDGPVEHTFTFTNSGRVAFVIEKVEVSCGCTTPVFTKTPILPGKRGTVTIKYDPRERPGTFIHDIRITSNKGRNNNTLRIRGEVVPRPRGVEDDYPFLYDGGLRFSVLSLNFGMVEQGKSKSMTIGYVNTSERPVALAFDIPAGRKFLTVTAPQMIAPGACGEITVICDLSKTEFYGRYTDRIIPIIDGERQDLVFSAIFTAIDNRDGAAVDDAPDIAIAPMFHHFGDVRRTDKLSCMVKLTNEGGQPLVIRWVSTKPFVSAGLKAGTLIEPDASVEFEVAVDPSQLDGGLNTGSVTVISNDPLRPVREIRFAINVK